MQRINALWNRGWVGKAIISLGVAVVACCVLALLVPRTPRQGQGAQPTSAPAAAQATEAPAPTQAPRATVGPTETPQPTDTPEPTETPSPIPATATPEPPIVIKGTGQTVTDKVTVPYQIGTVAFTHQGQGHVALHLYATGNERGDLLVNAIGAYEGTRLFQGESPVFFEVEADGAWELTIAPLTEERQAASASGRGDWVTGIFMPTETGLVPYRFTHNGQGHFAVHLHCSGARADLAQNEIGSVDNEAIVRFGDGPCLWEVTADGEWTIAPK